MKTNGDKALIRLQDCPPLRKTALTGLLIIAFLLCSCGTRWGSPDSSEASQAAHIAASAAPTATPESCESALVNDPEANPADLVTPDAIDSTSTEDSEANSPTPQIENSTEMAIPEPENAIESISVPAGDWAAILVNPSHYLPEDFQVSLSDFEGGQVDSRILEVCRQMFSDAQKDGVSLILVDAYRTRDRQNALYQKKVDSFVKQGYSRDEAEAEAATITARPDTSEHQTGLAMDIVTASYKIRDEDFSETKAFHWLDEHAHHYGFTLRYKKGKESVTKVIYEPWHWRFVGVEAATGMKESGACFEEYLGLKETEAALSP